MVFPLKTLQEPMRRVCARLAGLGIKLGSCNALEFFGREGDWHTVSYASDVAQLDAWEINPRFESALRNNLPHARIRIGDSFELSRLPEFATQFDFLVYDNPQVTFGETNQYCEHFEALATLPDLMKRNAVAIFNINREPFNYDSFPAWQKRRSDFYRCTNASRLDEGFLVAFYKSFLQDRGLTICNIFVEPRHEAYLAYFVAVVAKSEGQ